MLQAAAEAAGAQQYPAATLYVVATPIGNLADMTLRAIHVLALVDAIACEDTRHTAPLLRLFGIAKPLLALHQHNEHEGAVSVLLRLGRGERVAYVSDAGTPGLSDPGAVLVRSVQRAGYRTVPLPGASSALAALSVAGDVAPGFEFVGFLPARGAERSLSIEHVTGRRHTQIVFEAPHRIDALAKALAKACADRPVTLCRELTKQFETVATLPASELPGWLAADANRTRGEFVLVLHALDAAAAAPPPAGHDKMLVTLLGALPLRRAVDVAVALSGAPRNALYARALELRDQAIDGVEPPGA